MKNNVTDVVPMIGIRKRITALSPDENLPKSIFLRMSGARNHETSEPFLVPVQKYVVFDGILYAIHYSVERHPAYAGDEPMLAPPPCYKMSVVYFTVSEVTRGVKVFDSVMADTKGKKYVPIDDMHSCENLFLIYISQFTPEYVHQRRDEYPILNPIMGY